MKKRALIVLLAVAVWVAIGVFIMSRRPAVTRRALPATYGRAEGYADPARLDAPPPPMQLTQKRGRNLPIMDPVARDALSLVGVDAKADEYWIKAINNPSLPANERGWLREGAGAMEINQRRQLQARRPARDC